MTWRQCYVYGEYAALREWLCSYYPSDEADYAVDAVHAYLGPYILPLEQAGTITDEAGIEHPVYAPVSGRTDILCLVGVQDAEGEAALADLADSRPDVAIHYDATREQIAALYPEHCTGQAVPHFA